MSDWSATAATSTTGTTRALAAARAALRLDGRQRQPRRPSLALAHARRELARRPAAGPRGRSRDRAMRRRCSREAAAAAGDPATLDRRRWHVGSRRRAHGGGRRGRRPIRPGGTPGSPSSRPGARTCSSSRPPAWTKSGGGGPAERGRLGGGASSRRCASHARDARSARRDRGVGRRSLAAEAPRAGRRAWTSRFLFDPQRKLFSIGYRVARGRARPHLLRPARLRGAPRELRGDREGRRAASHWFRLGRPLTPVGRGSALVSWSGSMFEYLMPALVMRVAGRAACSSRPARLVVRRQIAYGDERGVPWGISESAYNARDLELTYQYSTFGVPRARAQARAGRGPGGRALRHRRSRRWSSRRPRCANLERLAAARRAAAATASTRRSTTPPRACRGRSRRRRARVHGAPPGHVAGGARQRAARRRDARAASTPSRSCQAAELLLQERTPRDVAVARPRAEEVHGRRRRARARARRRAALHLAARPAPAHAPALERPLRGDGHRGGLGLQPLARPRASPAGARTSTRDDWGTFVFLRDVAQRRGLVGGLPADAASSRTATRSRFSEDRAEIRAARRRDRDHARGRSSRPRTTPRCGASRSPTSGARPREIEVTSYAEIVLAPPAADAAHPAFSNLFVETEFVRRARRAARDPPAALAAASRRSGLAHVVARRGRDRRRPSQYETDRARFLGRGPRRSGTPLAVIDGRPLSNTVGAVLDPIFSLRRRVRLPPGATRARRVLDARRRRRATRPLDLADKYRDAGDLRARGDPRLDPGPGRAAPPRHRARRGAPLPAPRRAASSTPTRRCGRRPRCSRGNRRGQRRCGRTDLRRPADRAGAHRRARGPRTSCGSSCWRTSTGG